MKLVRIAMCLAWLVVLVACETTNDGADAAAAPDPRSTADAATATVVGEVPDAGMVSDVATQPDLFVPGGCCESDDECAEGQHCIGLAMDSLGVCVPIPTDGDCYEQRDCPEGRACTGAHVAICAMSSLPTTGTCVDMPDYCCWADEDCEEGTRCEGASQSGWGPGECRPIPESPDCFRDEDCPAMHHCIGAQACGCLVDCFWAGPGLCEPDGGACCFEDGDCAEGLHCVDPQIGGAAGTCRPPLTDGSCWGWRDCGQGEVCEGAQTCPCADDCDMEEQPGTCVVLEQCCASDADCPLGLTCASFPDYLDLQGACKPTQMDGMCWDQDDCPDTDICIGANPCPCGYSGEGDGCDIPGNCIDKEQYGCCTSDADCAGDAVCGIGSTCVAPIEFGQCWSDDDCYETQQCTGVTVCPCGLLCFVGTMPGQCTPLPQGCCYDDGDCGEGFVCRAYEATVDHMPGACVPDPSGPQCIGDQACCWNDGDCGEGGSCDGAYACGCIELCHSCGACMTDQMGLCQ